MDNNRIIIRKQKQNELLYIDPKQVKTYNGYTNAVMTSDDLNKYQGIRIDIIAKNAGMNKTNTFIVPFTEEIKKIAMWNIEDYDSKSEDEKQKILHAFIEKVLININDCKFYDKNNTLFLTHKYDVSDVKTVFMQKVHTPESNTMLITCNYNFSHSSLGGPTGSLAARQNIIYYVAQRSRSAKSSSSTSARKRSKSSLRSATLPMQTQEQEQAQTQEMHDRLRKKARTSTLANMPKRMHGNGYNKYMYLQNKEGKKVRKKLFFINGKQKVYVKRDKYVSIETYRKKYLNKTYKK